MADVSSLPPTNHVPLAFEEDEFDDHDSALGSEVASDTQTINSFITHYTWQNGRRYHAEHIFNGRYWGPNDEYATEQQHLTHHLWKLTLGDQLHSAPIGNPHVRFLAHVGWIRADDHQQNILDLGTGAGSWAIEMADEYPGAHVIGTDLSPVQSPFVPSNCHFEVQDVTMPWTWPANEFDLIHIRELFGSIPDWDYLFRQSYDAMKPGGWIEILEHSVFPVSDYGTCGPDAMFTRWGKVVMELGVLSGNSFSIWSESKERVEKAGFVDVVEIRYKWPMNGWNKNSKRKELGMWNQLRLFNGLEDFMLRPLTQTAGWPLERAQQFMEEMRDALLDLNTRAYLDVTVVYGRKPN